MRVHPGGILRNFNIRSGAILEKRLENNSLEKQQQKTNSKELWRKNRRDVVVRSANLAEFVFYSISGDGKLLWLLSCLS